MKILASKIPEKTCFYIKKCVLKCGITDSPNPIAPIFSKREYNKFSYTCIVSVAVMPVKAVYRVNCSTSLIRVRWKGDGKWMRADILFKLHDVALFSSCCSKVKYMYS